MVYDEETNNKTVKWAVNMDAVIENFRSIIGFDDDKKLQPFVGPSLFINGSYSSAKLQEDGALPSEEL